MCAPMSMVPALIGAASTAVSLIRQRSIARSNERASQDWANYQRRMRTQETERQEGLREQAELNRQEGLKKLGGENQQNIQQNEQSRLEQILAPPVSANKDINTTVSSNLLSGQQRGSQIFQDDFRARLSQATQEARKRIAALAKLQSFGGSSNGLEVQNQRAFTDSANAIDLANNQRSGSLQAYGAAKNVNPVRFFG